LSVLVLISLDSSLSASHRDNNISINILVILESVLQYVVKYELVEVPIRDHIFVLRKVHDKEDVDPPFKHVMLKWPNNIPKGADDVGVWFDLHLYLVLLHFHSLYLIGVIKPYGLCRLLNAYDIM
jgi:hypothetical protein